MLKSNGRLGHALELAVALAALVTSVTSIWLSLSQGDDMAPLAQVRHDLLPDEAAPADDDDLHSDPLTTPVVTEQ